MAKNSSVKKRIKKINPLLSNKTSVTLLEIKWHVKIEMGTKSLQADWLNSQGKKTSHWNCTLWK